MRKKYWAMILVLLLVIPLMSEAQVAEAGDSLLSQKTARRLLLQSLVLPGWGEHSLNYHRRGFAFNSSELLLWVGFATLSYLGNSAEQDMQAYAARHAGINPVGKDIYYFTDIGNYANIYEYNEQKMRYRQYANLYPESSEYFWAWDSEASRRKFDRLRYNSQQILHIASFAIGGLVVNRIISVIDIIALTKERLEPVENSVQALVYPQRDAVTFTLNFGFR